MIYGSDETSRSLKSLLEEELKKNLICVDSFIEFSESLKDEIVENITASDKPNGIALIGVTSKGM